MATVAAGDAVAMAEADAADRRAGSPVGFPVDSQVDSPVVGAAGADAATELSHRIPVPANALLWR